MDDIPQIKPDAPATSQVMDDKVPKSVVLPASPQVPSSTAVPVPDTKRKLSFSLKTKWGNFKTSKKAKKVLLGVGIFLLVFLLAVVLPLVNLYFKSKPLIASSQSMAEVVKTQDLNLIKQGLEEVNNNLKPVKSAYKFVSWMRILPFAGNYVKDLDHTLEGADHGIKLSALVLTTVEPYADFLGLKTDVVTDGEKTAQERIDFIIAALPDIAKNADEIANQMTLVSNELKQIDPNRYPEKVKDRVVRENLRKGLELLSQAERFIANGKPVIEAAPYLLGIDDKRTYLVIFQNDKELRASGGFLTAYSIMDVDKGKFEPVTSNDIYNLDAQYRPNIEAPDPIIDYLKGPYTISKYLFLRDLNWSPDFTQSMQTFLTEAQTAGIPDVDGIIGVDTQLLVYLLAVTGPIGVPGFGNFSSDIVEVCNCPQVVYELELFADVEGPIVWDPISGEIVYQPANADNRKVIIGPLMNSVLANIFAQPKDKLPDLINAVTKSLFEKHIMFYITDEKVHGALSDFGITGGIEDFDGDYLHISDANLGGRKSNLYVKQSVEQDIEVTSDGIIKTVTITYNNPEKHDGWLNSVLPNWVRIYVPKGSELIAFEGVEDQKEPYEDLGKTVFSGYFELRPEGVAKVTLKYKVPIVFEDGYKLMIQKQPGTDKPLHTINIGRTTDEFFLDQDKVLSY